MIQNVLAERYASPAISNIWSAEGRIILEREFWIAVMKAQHDLGLDIPADAIAAYEAVIDQVNLPAIAERERITRHDVKARIEEFNDLAGHEHIHKGMTSRDLTENVEQLQVFRSLLVIRDKAVTTLARLGERAEQWKDLIITARTHNVAAQPTTFGKRIAMFGEELHGAYSSLENLISHYKVRGLKGAVGTQMDTISLFNGDASKVIDLERRIVAHLGIPDLYINVGQVYPRSLDLATVSALTDLGSSPSSLCKTLRLMAGHETASEGFAPGQTGSSAMPHKMNSRSCERVNGFHTILKGYLTMAGGLSGDQWNEGDVSCSVVRRVMLPDSFFAIDGLFETFLTIISQMDAYEAVIAAENNHYFPFLMTTTFMMEAVKAGVGRETAHEIIKEHAVATVADLRTGEVKENNLVSRLGNDDRFPIDEATLSSILESSQNNSGAAPEQIAHFLELVASAKQAHPEAASYAPGSIL
ncbi:adenylosuccinate lyase [Akkermansiaceae bacterium]|nr:adenylosuccinate lyase [Akkermansiaceae bacterium]MDB4277257.1 adenylosuccinate lyase [bacterium]MDA7518694.1 adenylosuccinate lyase [Akkermansiaceae bacterium]MDA7650957.1 adenylosuccinate lyase [Akkermansiaceae bacterium]MDA7862072.1 adenylosuccinate lyase [Akkermansiaceae bacterium]